MMYTQEQVTDFHLLSAGIERATLDDARSAIDRLVEFGVDRDTATLVTANGVINFQVRANEVADAVVRGTVVGTFAPQEMATVVATHATRAAAAGLTVMQMTIALGVLSQQSTATVLAVVKFRDLLSSGDARQLAADLVAQAELA